MEKETGKNVKYHFENQGQYFGGRGEEREREREKGRERVL